VLRFLPRAADTAGYTGHGSWQQPTLAGIYRQIGPASLAKVLLSERHHAAFARNA